MYPCTKDRHAARFLRIAVRITSNQLGEGYDFQELILVWAYNTVRDAISRFWGSGRGAPLGNSPTDGS